MEGSRTTEARSSGLSPLLRVTNLSKTFPGQLALVNARLEVLPGEVHGLVGQNGSGKSTLIKILAGYHDPDPGAVIEFCGEPLHDRRSLAFVHQDLALVPTLNSIDNLALGRAFARRASGGIDWRAEARHAAQAVGEFGGDFDVYEPVGRLSRVERSIVAMARALQHLGTGPSLLVLDEPTAALPEPEVELLFAAIRRVASSGTGVIYVSHHLQEVFEVCDRVTVLRDGHSTASIPTASITHHDLIHLILGRDLGELYSVPPPPRQDVVMEINGLVGGHLRELSLRLAAGEIVGIAGLLGSGRRDALKAIFGSLPASRGALRINGAVVRAGSPRAAIRAGIALVPSDRAEQALIPGHSVAHNVTLPLLRPLLRRGVLDRRRERRDVERWIEEVDLRPRNQDQQIEYLSGGNQQKTVISRWLRIEPKVLLLDEPTQGVDVGAKAAIYRLLAAAAERGVGVVVSSSDGEELAAICDRVLVMREGCVATELSGDALSEDRITRECLVPTAA